MPSDKQGSSHHRQVSSRVAYNRKHAHYAVEEYNAHYDFNKEQQGNVSYLTSELDIVGVWSVIHHFFPYGYLCQ